jgi:hypothetical protein
MGGKNLPIGIEMDTQALLPATKTFKKRASIKQSNELTEAAYYLPLQAKRVLWLCLMQAYFNDNQEDDSDVLPLFKISVSDYVKYFNVATSVASRDVKAGVNALGESTVTFYPKEGEFEEVKRPWLAEAGMKRGRGSWQIEFNYKVMPFLVGLTSSSLPILSMTVASLIVFVSSGFMKACVSSGALVSGSPHMTGYVKGLCSLPRRKTILLK